jgi:hypothetical protein
MVIVDFIMKLIGRPPLLENGYPNMAANHEYVNIDGERIRDITRRLNGRFNGGGFYIPPPPPIPQHQLPEENTAPPMIAEIVNKISSKPPVRETPSSTSSLNICGTTITDFAKTIENKKDPLVLDHLPLKHFLVKKYPWILDVTEVRVRTLGRLTHPIYESTIVYGPLEIHITVSPTHHSELMNEGIERKIREKLYVEMMPLITCLYENNNKDNPYIIFSPSHSETILEYVK